jgi:hypothetical protein
MKKFSEFITALLVSITIGLAISYATILIPFMVDISFLEAVAVYHFWIHLANYLKTYEQVEEE